MLMGLFYIPWRLVLYLNAHILLILEIEIMCMHVKEHVCLKVCVHVYFDYTSTFRSILSQPAPNGMLVYYQIEYHVLCLGNEEKELGITWEIIIHNILLS